MNWIFQKLQPRRTRDAGIATAGAEANLRAALTEPAAPGEDESYRRLMGVIADDMRLRAPAPARRGWSWMPVTSVSAAAAIFIALAYTAGVDRGVRIARQTPPQYVATLPPATEPVVPHGQYVPPVKPAPTMAQPAPPAPKPAPPSPATDAAPMNYIGNIALEGLSRDQRDMLAIYVRQAEAGEWASAARSLERLANTDPGSDVAMTALLGAAEIYRGRLHDNASALGLYRREQQALTDQLASAADAGHKSDLQARLDQVRAGIAELAAADD
jgi:hypothetical protein